MRRFIFALALFVVPFAAEAQRPRGLNFEVGLDKVIVVPVVTATTQTAAKFFTYTPGFAFRVISIKTYCRAKAGTVTGQVRVGTDTTTVLDSALVFNADSTEYAGRIKARFSRVGAGSTSSIRVYYTTDGTGALTNGFVVLRIRPL
jgi:hypothetical protein